jgi:hypothetical protein
MTRRTLYLPVVIAAALAMACLVALLAVSQKAEATFPGKNGRIAFEGDRDTGTGGSSAEIITVSPDGTGMKQLTSASGSGNPTFSPNGEKIAYAANYGAGTRGIYVMNRSGNAKKALTDSNNVPLVPRRHQDCVHQAGAGFYPRRPERLAGRRLGDER